MKKKSIEITRKLFQANDTGWEGSKCIRENESQTTKLRELKVKEDIKNIFKVFKGLSAQF